VAHPLKSRVFSFSLANILVFTSLTFTCLVPFLILFLVVVENNGTCLSFLNLSLLCHTVGSCLRFIDLFLCEISSSHGGEYDVQSCLLGCTAV
jgi:hypothetical protein